MELWNSFECGSFPQFDSILSFNRIYKAAVNRLTPKIPRISVVETPLEDDEETEFIG